MNSTYSPQTRCCWTKCVFQDEDARKDAQVSLWSMKTTQKWVCRLIKLYKVCVRNTVDSSSHLRRLDAETYWRMRAGRRDGGSAVSGAGGDVIDRLCFNLILIYFYYFINAKSTKQNKSIHTNSINNLSKQW